jgi:hypothetical protein
MAAVFGFFKELCGISKQRWNGSPTQRYPAQYPYSGATTRVLVELTTP